MDSDRNVVDRVIKGRRSIRAFEDRAVSRAEIEDLLEIARWAPSGSNSQPWRVTVAAGEPAAVVNVASMAALISGPVSQAAYNASKHGVQALTESLALELAEAGAPIAVHVVNPGPVATRIFTDAPTAGERGAGARDDYHAMVTEQGISGDEAGAIVVAGVERGGFWIETHPEMRAAASAQRARMLTGALPPAPPDLG